MTDSKLTIPPMPELPLSLHKPGDHLYGNVNKLREWGQECAAIAQREAALADELAEALKDAFSWLEAQPLMDRMIEMGSPEVTKLFHECPAALAKHTAARQMNKEARNG